MKITREIRFFLSSIVQNVLDFIFPSTCPCCDKTIESNNLFCDTCFHQITFIKKPMCYRCGQPLPIEITNKKVLCSDCLKKRPLFDLARAVFIYDYVSKDCILKLKYADRMEYAYPLVELLHQAGGELFEKTDIIMPVPMHWRRKLLRKYNQADLLGRLLAKKEHLLYSSNNLLRARYTQVQENKTISERNKNVKDAFCVKYPEKIKNKSILLVDDVLTTGATVNNCAKALKKEGAKAVYVLTVAKTLKR